MGFGWSKDMIGQKVYDFLCEGSFCLTVFLPCYNLDVIVSFNSVGLFCKSILSDLLPCSNYPRQEASHTENCLTCRVSDVSAVHSGRLPCQLARHRALVFCTCQTNISLPWLWFRALALESKGAKSIKICQARSCWQR